MAEGSAVVPEGPGDQQRPDAALLAEVWHRRPRVVVKADLLPAVSVLSLVALLGIGIGWAWSMIAPPERWWVRGDGQPVPLIEASYHRFDDLAIFLLINLGAGLLVAMAVWLLRGRRGPVVMIAAVIGAAIGGWLAMRTGVSFAQAWFQLPDAPGIGSVIDRAPQLDTIAAVAAQPLAIAFGYGALAAWSGRHDLGRRLG